MTEQDRIESALIARLVALYGDCVEIIQERLKELIAALQDLDEEPQGARSEEEFSEWKDRRFSVLLRRYEAEKVVSDELGLAGEAAVTLITAAIVDIYTASYKQDGQRIIKEAARLHRKPIFVTQTRRMVQNILNDSRDYFTEKSFTNLRSNRRAAMRYRKALVKSTLKGESHQKLVKRFLDIIGDTSSASRAHASLLAQTERTRAQSEANEEIADQAVAQGFRMYDEWSCAMIAPHKTPNGWSSGSRESHKELNGKIQPHGQPFRTILGNDLRYPGDPSVPAKERCNCHCIKYSHLLLDDEEIINGQVVKKVD